MKWPFKVLKQQSTWPLQGLVVQFAAAIISLPVGPQRIQAANKMIERCIRMGARLAAEFGMPGDVFVEVAKAQIIREAPGAKQQIAEAFGEQVVKAVDNVEQLEDFAQQIGEAFKGGFKGDTPEEPEA